MLTLIFLSLWAERWVPEDLAAAQHDLDVITFWLILRADVIAFSEWSVVLVFDIGG